MRNNLFFSPVTMFLYLGIKRFYHDMYFTFPPLTYCRFIALNVKLLPIVEPSAGSVPAGWRSYFLYLNQQFHSLPYRIFLLTWRPSLIDFQLMRFELDDSCKYFNHSLPKYYLSGPENNSHQVNRTLPASLLFPPDHWRTQARRLGE